MKKLALAACIAMSPSIALAEMSYTYFEVSAQFGTIDFSPGEYDSTDISGGASFAVGKNVALVMGADFGDIDLPAPLSASGSTINFGVIGHAPAADNVDLILGMAIGRVEVEASNGVTTITDDDTSNSILFGVRAAPTESAEAEFKIISTDSFGSRDESFGITGRINFSESVAGSVSYNWSDSHTGVAIGARIMF